MSQTRNEPRLRRSMLICPGNRPERIAKAATLPANSIVLDLEDGVAPADKSAARHSIVDALATIAFGPRERVVRVNAVGTPEHKADLEMLAATDLSNLDALFVPKVESAEQLQGLDLWLATKEVGNRSHHAIEIVATIETPRGLFRAVDIADATRRTTALFFGSGDYTAATGSAVTERALAIPRGLIVAAAAAAGLEAIDAAEFNDVKSADAARADALIARELGFSGKLVFHPNQLAPVNEVFTPAADDVARARRVVDAYTVARANGQGTAVVDGVFVALDIFLMAERVISRATRAAARQSQSGL